jgi:DNA-binding PadR family transcriptional regulator
MSALAAERTDRRARQGLIEALLREVEDRRRELYRLKAGGVQRAGVRDQKQELLQVHRHLHEVVAV